MPDKTKIPAVRFTDFADDWEQRQLGDVADIIGGGTPSTSNAMYWSGDIDWYAPAEIGEQIYLKGSQKKITELGLQKSSAKMLPVGTVLFTSRAGIGNTAILAKTGATNQGFQSIVPHKGDLDSYFIFSRTPELKLYGETVGAGSTFVEVSGKQMAKMSIMIPTINEQIRIGNLFHDLDHLITLHQREHDKIVKVKKAMLEKMFPKEGENKPEIRFAGFTDAWEQRRFVDVFDPIRNNSLSRANLNYDDGEVKNIHYGDILIKYGSIVDCRSDIIPFITGGKTNDYSDQLLQNGDVLIADAAEDETVGKAVEIQGIASNSVVSGLHTIACRPRITIQPRFLGYYMNTPSYHQQLLPLMQGTKVLSLSRTNLANTIVFYPNSESEQASISRVFTDLDALITLHQRELEKLQNIKKALLEKMFV